MSSFTYSGNPGSSAADQVRFLIGDTNPAAPLLLDGEIAWLLADSNQDPLSAAVRACESIVAKLARSRDETVGSVSIKFSQDLAGYAATAAALRRRMAKRAVPYAGGISVADKYANRSNADRVKPSFTRDLMQTPDDPETLAGLDIDGVDSAVGEVVPGGGYGTP